MKKLLIPCPCGEEGCTFLTIGIVIVVFSLVTLWTWLYLSK